MKMENSEEVGVIYSRSIGKVKMCGSKASGSGKEYGEFSRQREGNVYFPPTGLRPVVSGLR